MIFAACIVQSVIQHISDIAHHVIRIGDGTKADTVGILCGGIQDLLSLAVRLIDRIIRLGICFLHDLMLLHQLLCPFLCVSDQCICFRLRILQNGVLIADDLLIPFDLIRCLQTQLTQIFRDLLLVHNDLTCRKRLIFTAFNKFFNFFNDLLNPAAHYPTLLIFQTHSTCRVSAAPRM